MILGIMIAIGLVASFILCLCKFIKELRAGNYWESISCKVVRWLWVSSEVLGGICNISYIAKMGSMSSVITQEQLRMYWWGGISAFFMIMVPVNFLVFIVRGIYLCKEK